MRRDFKILTSYWFIAGLTILLLNDFVFKEAYSNWLTGKLSDFAGLLIFPIFWTVLFPGYKSKIFWLTGFLFIYWKSSFSQEFLDAWNSLGILSISRVVDYTDLIALTILPIAYDFENKKQELKSIRVSPIIPLTITAFSFLATSYHTDIDINKVYSFDFSKDTLEKRIFYLPSIMNPFTNYNFGDTAQVDGTSNPYNSSYTPEVDDTSINDFISDSMDLFVYEDFCFEGYSATIILSGDKDKSSLRLTSFHHRCPRDGKQIIPIKRHDDLKVLTESFEKKIIEELRKVTGATDTTQYISTGNFNNNQGTITDSIKTFIIDYYPVTDDMFKGNDEERKSGEVLSSEKAWFSNDTLKQTLVFELYTDNYRMVSYHFHNNDIPEELIRRMELHVKGGGLATDEQKIKYMKGFLNQTKKIDQVYFSTNKGFRLGDSKFKAIKVYGQPDSVSTTKGIERCEWDFIGDIFYDGKTDLKGKPVAKNSYGHQAIMFFKANKLIGIIFHNDIP